ncbi:MAG: DUF4910 domain-containing protein [Bacillota bacterium]|jgi:aminopeptidase YwaD
MEKLFKMLEQELSGRQAWRYAERIAQYNRIQASPGYRDAAIQVVQLLGREGVAARIEDFPARSGVRFLSRQSFQEWRCRGGELWLLGEDGGKRRLSRYQEQEVSLVQRSAPTPPEGIEAELISVPEAENPESYRGLELQGKIALVRGNPMTIHGLAVEEHGALGLVFDNLNSYPPLRTRADMPDAIQYTSFWWSGREKPAFGFCVSPRVGEELRAKLSQGPVKLFAQVDSDLGDGTLENVEYFIPGRQEEEVLLVAHLCHPYPGAQDNASGPAVLMEVARTLHRLLEQGDLEQPQLGIRFLMVPEMTGTFAYFDRHPERIETTVAALNLDMVGADQSKGGGPLCIEEPPLATPTFLNDYAYRILESFSKEVRNFGGTFGYSTCHFVATPFSGGSDHYVISDPSIGIPCPMLIQWPDKHYHSSLDHPVNLDPAMLKRVGLLAAQYAWGLAAGSEESWLDFFWAYSAGTCSRIFQALEGAWANHILRAELAQVLEFHLDYEKKALEELGRYAQLRGFNRLTEALAWGRDQVDGAGELAREWVAKRGGGAADLEPLAESVATRVYQRIHPGPLDMNAELIRLPMSRRLEWTRFARKEGASSGYATFLLYWLDGKRPLGQVLELVKWESGAWHPRFAVEYLELCRELGLVRRVS